MLLTRRWQDASQTGLVMIRQDDARWTSADDHQIRFMMMKMIVYMQHHCHSQSTPLMMIHREIVLLPWWSMFLLILKVNVANNNIVITLLLRWFWKINSLTKRFYFCWDSSSSFPLRTWSPPLPSWSSPLPLASTAPWTSSLAGRNLPDDYIGQLQFLRKYT